MVLMLVAISISAEPIMTEEGLFFPAEDFEHFVIFYETFEALLEVVDGFGFYSFQNTAILRDSFNENLMGEEKRIPAFIVAFQKFLSDQYNLNVKSYNNYIVASYNFEYFTGYLGDILNKLSLSEVVSDD